jgi:hypothetical protein
MLDAETLRQREHGEIEAANDSGTNHRLTESEQTWSVK